MVAGVFGIASRSAAQPLSTSAILLLIFCSLFIQLDASTNSAPPKVVSKELQHKLAHFISKIKSSGPNSEGEGAEGTNGPAGLGGLKFKGLGFKEVKSEDAVGAATNGGVRPVAASRTPGQVTNHVGVQRQQPGEANAGGLGSRNESQPEFHVFKNGKAGSLMCEKVAGVNGAPGLLCRPLALSPHKYTQNATQSVAQKVAKQLAKQASIIAPQKPQLHAAPAVYRWQMSSTFQYIPSKKHFYNVHYADNSALKIKTGLDIITLGPYKVFSRFGLIEEAVSGQPGADLQGADGIMGFGYSDYVRSASVVKTLHRRARPSWNLTQPAAFHSLKIQTFTILTSEYKGELQLGGYDSKAAAEPVQWTPMNNKTGYGVDIVSVKYGGLELLDLGVEGQKVGSMLGVFDTGSTCIEMPRGLFKGYYGSSLFDNFAKVASHDPGQPLVLTLSGGAQISIPQDVWSEPWGCMTAMTDYTPILCFPSTPILPANQLPVFSLLDSPLVAFAALNSVRRQQQQRFRAPQHLSPFIFSHASGTNPFMADNVMLLGMHFFRAYMVVHDLDSTHYRMGFARINPTYLSTLGTEETAKVPEPGKVAKVPLDLVPRVHLFMTIGVGSPPQKFRCVFDTGSILLAVFAGNISSRAVQLEQSVQRAEVKAPIVGILTFLRSLSTFEWVMLATSVIICLAVIHVVCRRFRIRSSSISKFP